MFEADVPGKGKVLTEAQALAHVIRMAKASCQKMMTARRKTDEDFDNIQVTLKAIDLSENVLARFNASELQAKHAPATNGKAPEPATK